MIKTCCVKFSFSWRERGVQSATWGGRGTGLWAFYTPRKCHLLSWWRFHDVLTSGFATTELISVDILSHVVSSSLAARGERSRGIVMILVFSFPAQGKISFQISFALRGFPSHGPWSGYLEEAHSWHAGICFLTQREFRWDKTFHSVSWSSWG